ncbi:MAG: N-acetylmuramoyl-L-alanine amidase-like domain-containing protein [Legionellales bacterium]
MKNTLNLLYCARLQTAVLARGFLSARSLIFIGCCTSFFSHAIDSHAIEKQANVFINELYHKANATPNTLMPQRIDWFSAKFLGDKYLLGALGEGPGARYDQFPKYRTDAFDCDTYVTTVVSLALAHSLKSFQQCLKHTRYQNGKATYLYRNHFTSIDWNKNNQQRGVLKDITLTIKDQNQRPVALFANALINKSNWYAYKSIATIRLEHENKTQQATRLLELKAQGKNLKTSRSKVPYLPFTALFTDKSKPNLYLFAQIPQGAIIEIIRPNWDLRKLIGTSLNISHLGFAIWIKGHLYFRQASSQQGKVVDVLLVEYLKEAQKSPTIKGINIQIVKTKPLDAECK